MGHGTMALVMGNTFKAISLFNDTSSFRKTCNAVFEKKLHKRRMKVLERLCPIDRKMKLDKIKSTSAQRTMKPKFR